MYIFPLPAVSPFLCKVPYKSFRCLLAPPGEVVGHPVFEGIECELGHRGELGRSCQASLDEGQGLVE